MASIIPNRKPETPVQQLLTTGSYASKIDIPQFKPQAAFPVIFSVSINQGPASSIFERNKRANEEINIKPITQNKVSAEFYNPKNYLDPYKTQVDRRDISLSSIHQTTIFNRKQAQQQELGTSRPIDKTQFLEMKKYGSEGIMPAIKSQSLNNTGVKEIPEYRNYISQNENVFYQSSKIFFKPNTQVSKYSFSTPDYFRATRTIKKENGETVTVISRNNGWLTVDPETMSRKNAYEKKLKGNLHKTSHMSPGWMHTQAQRDEQQMKSFKPQTVKNQNLRCESNRVFLSDRQEPPKSIFNLGQVRHNLLTKDDAIKTQSNFKNFTDRPVRLIEWVEDPGKQKYDKKVVGKIGQTLQ